MNNCKTTNSFTHPVIQQACVCNMNSIMNVSPYEMLMQDITFQCKNTQDITIRGIKFYGTVNHILWLTHRLIMHTPFHRLSVVLSILHLPFIFLKELDE
jgi:hypothetical protein